MQCKNDLKNDEEIFAEKAREMVNIQERMTALDEDNSELVQKIEELEKVVRQQQEQILAKQMENEELTNKMKAKKLKFVYYYNLWHSCWILRWPVIHPHPQKLEVWEMSA